MLVIEGLWQMCVDQKDENKKNMNDQNSKKLTEQGPWVSWYFRSPLLRYRGWLRNPREGFYFGLDSDLSRLGSS